MDLASRLLLGSEQEAGREVLDQVDALLERAPDPVSEVRATCIHGVFDLMQGDVRRATEHLDEVWQRIRACPALDDDPRLMSRGVVRHADLWAAIGLAWLDQYEDARRAIARSARPGGGRDAMSEHFRAAALSCVAVGEGHLADGERWARGTFAEMDETGDRHHITVFALCSYGRRRPGAQRPGAGRGSAGAGHHGHRADGHQPVTHRRRGGSRGGLVRAGAPRRSPVPAGSGPRGRREPTSTPDVRLDPRAPGVAAAAFGQPRRGRGGVPALVRWHGAARTGTGARGVWRAGRRGRAARRGAGRHTPPGAARGPRPVPRRVDGAPRRRGQGPPGRGTRDRRPARLRAHRHRVGSARPAAARPHPGALGRVRGPAPQRGGHRGHGGLRAAPSTARRPAQSSGARESSATCPPR